MEDWDCERENLVAVLVDGYVRRNLGVSLHRFLEVVLHKDVPRGHSVVVHRHSACVRHGDSLELAHALRRHYRLLHEVVVVHVDILKIASLGLQHEKLVVQFDLECSRIQERGLLQKVCGTFRNGVVDRAFEHEKGKYDY